MLVAVPFASVPQGYDGGDCCECTCDDESRCGTERGFGGSGYDCLDPSADCEKEEAELDDDDSSGDKEMSDTGCNEDALGDSVCDEENNNEACGESTRGVEALCGPAAQRGVPRRIAETGASKVHTCA